MIKSQLKTHKRSFKFQELNEQKKYHKKPKYKLNIQMRSVPIPMKINTRTYIVEKLK